MVDTSGAQLFSDYVPLRFAPNEPVSNWAERTDPRQDGGDEGVAQSTSEFGEDDAPRESTSEQLKHPYYSRLSKSSKRRARKGMQKQKQKPRVRNGNESEQEGPEVISEDLRSEEEATNQDQDKPNPVWDLDETAHNHSLGTGISNRFNHLPSDSNEIAVPKRLAQWRKRKLERGTGPLSHCYGRWHHFACGHRVNVLCRDCAYYWTMGISQPCHRREYAQVAKERGTEDRGHVGGRNCQFEVVCPECAERGRSVNIKFKKPWSGNYPYWTWKVARFQPKYLSAETVVQNHETQFYSRWLDMFLYFESGDSKFIAD
ncbi:hypothetical protein K458DRAFT_399837 [Lentithecium fluviatile CBS 122367]|uniref:Zinc-binding domain-containing protein n=1 Tax=Lentithecium fluviatile CBS 122367 TaxID=1168545 RepID=A0A6G1JK61_9PLEO|nr:hypothetical protein K458DRAFT_399837 [Lentithecium fluviatile CBS 122367]